MAETPRHREALFTLAPPSCEGETAHCTDVAVSSDGRVLAVVHVDGRHRKFWLTLLDVSTPASPRLLRVHDDLGVERVDFAPDGRTLVCARFRVVTLVDVESGATRQLDDRHNDAAFMPDGEHLVLGGYAPQIVTRGGATILALAPGSSARLEEFIPSPDGRYLAARGPAPHLYIFDAATGVQSRRFTARGKGYAPVGAFSPDGELLAWGGSREDGHDLWGIEVRKVGGKWPVVHTLPGHTRFIVDLRFSPDGALVAAASANVTTPGGEVGLWEVATGRPRRVIGFDAAGMEPHRVCFFPDGAHLVVGDHGDGHVGIFAL